MASNFIKALENEISDLIAELQSDLRFQRLEELRRILRLYRQSDGVGTTITDDMLEFNTLSSNDGARGSRSTKAERERLVDAIQVCLVEHNKPVPTSEIIEYLQALGIRVPGQNPKNNLASLLSLSPMFVSRGRSGWTLHESYIREAQRLRDSLNNSLDPSQPRRKVM